MLEPLTEGFFSNVISGAMLSLTAITMSFEVAGAVESFTLKEINDHEKIYHSRTHSLTN